MACWNVKKEVDEAAVKRYEEKKVNRRKEKAKQKKDKKDKKDASAAAHLLTLKPLAQLSTKEVYSLLLNIDSLRGYAQTLYNCSLSGDVMCMLESAEDLKDFGPILKFGND